MKREFVVVGSLAAFFVVALASGASAQYPYPSYRGVDPRTGQPSQMRFDAFGCPRTDFGGNIGTAMDDVAAIVHRSGNSCRYIPDYGGYLPWMNYGSYGAYGLPGQPMYDRNGQPFTARDGAVAGGILGAGIGAARGGTRGAIIGGAIGGVGGWAVGRLIESRSGGSGGGSDRWTLENNSGLRAYVRIGGGREKRLLPGEMLELKDKDARKGKTALVEYAVPGGRTERRETQLVNLPDGSGWEIVAPRP